MVFYPRRCSCDMPFVKEDPPHLSKSRLKSGLVDHNVELYLRHGDQKKAADFSSDDDDDDQIRDAADEDLEAAKMPDPSSLTDADLKAMLVKYGVKPGPIVASTRLLYERKLRKLLQSDGHDGAENNVWYSDSEEERERHEEEENKESVLEQEIIEVSESQQESTKRACSPRNKKPSSRRNSKNVIKSSEQTVSHRSRIPAGISKTSSSGQRSGLKSGVPSGVQSVGSNGCSSFEAFSITQMVEEMETRRSFSASSDELNSNSVLERTSQYDRLDLQFKDKNRLADQSIYCTPKDSCREQGRKVHQEPVGDILKDIFPNTQTSPTGIYATPRRPIKGAAQRPIQFSYPDTPVSPLTQERREVERRLVPVQIQIMVFFILMFVLYLIYVNVEHSSPVLALLESLNQRSDD